MPDSNVTYRITTDRGSTLHRAADHTTAVALATKYLGYAPTIYETSLFDEDQGKWIPIRSNVTLGSGPIPFLTWDAFNQTLAESTAAEIAMIDGGTWEAQYGTLHPRYRAALVAQLAYRVKHGAVIS